MYNLGADRGTETPTDALAVDLGGALAASALVVWVTYQSRSKEGTSEGAVATVGIAPEPVATMVLTAPEPVAGSTATEDCET